MVTSQRTVVEFSIQYSMILNMSEVIPVVAETWEAKISETVWSIQKKPKDVVGLLHLSHCHVPTQALVLGREQVEEH